MKFKFKFAENLKLFIGIVAVIMAIGIVFNVIFGVSLDIQFSGGTIVTYTYSGDIKEADLKSAVKEICGDNVMTSISKNLSAEEDNEYTVSIQYSGNQTVTPDKQQKTTKDLQTRFKDNNFELYESNSVDATMGLKFFLKCICAIALASVIMILYVAWRFKKIKGLSAGCTAIIALLIDVSVVYFSFVIFKFPIDSNFIAVVLTIIGYSLNDTIVIYDRVRENRAKLPKTVTNAELYNISANEVLTRTILTTVTTCLAIGSVLGVALVYNLDTVVTFALPMIVSLISGSFTSLCIAGPLWVAWQDKKASKSK